MAFDQFMLCLKQTGGDAMTDQALNDHYQFLSACFQEVYCSWPAIKTYTNEGTLHWLREMRVANIVEQAMQAGWSSTRMQDEISAEIRHLTALGAQQMSMYAFGSANNDLTLGLDRFPCSLGMLNHRMGGGFVRSEACLMAGPSNSGKSAAASQLLGEMAMQGRKCLYVTTEQTQPKKIVEAKIISQQTDIPYSLLSTGLNMGRLNPEQQARVEKLFTRINASNMFIVHWWEHPSDKYLEQMTLMCDQAAQAMGGLDCFVFDWIGATMTADVQSDVQKLRLAYQRSADSFATLTAQLGVFGIVMAQCSALQWKTARLVGPENLSECKTMHRERPAMVGISGLSSGDESDNPNAERLAKEQWLNVAKTRHGAGGSVPVTRDMGYQRFKTRFSQGS